MARGRQTSSPSAQVKKGGKRSSAVSSTSTAAALRQASLDADETTVFLHGKTHKRTGEQAARKAGVPSDQQGSRLRLLPVAPDVSFWRGVCRPALLVQALANIGTLVEADPTLLFSTSQSRYSFWALTVDRLLTAIQAILDASNLFLQPADEKSGDGRSLNSALCQRWEIIRKLVQLAESAVPMKSSILFASATAGNSDTTQVPPTTLLALQKRLRCLQRLLQLRENHLRIMTSLRRCKTKKEVATALFGAMMGPFDTVEPMPGITSWHQQEQRLIKTLMEQANSIDPCSESWGASIVPPLRVAGGSYILHRSSRFKTLASLLSVAEFFGLPPFLRSVRIARGRARALPSQTTMSDADGFGHFQTDSLSSFFLAPCDLDPRRFDDLAPSQTHVVQEEIIDLAARHCCFGALVGEADQIAALLHANANAAGRGLTVKTEPTDEAAEPSRTATAEGAGSDLLFAYAQWLGRTAKDSDKKHAKVHWLCSNRWNPAMSYYALVIVTVPPNSGDDVVWKNEDDEEEGACGVAAAPYYVAAVLELVRF